MDSRMDVSAEPDYQELYNENKRKLLDLINSKFNENSNLKFICSAVDFMVKLIENGIEFYLDRALLPNTYHESAGPVAGFRSSAKIIIGGIAHMTASLLLKWIYCILIAVANRDVWNSLDEGACKAKNKCTEEGGSTFRGYLEYAKAYIGLFANLLKACFLRGFDMLGIETDEESKQRVINSVNAAIDQAINSVELVPNNRLMLEGASK